MVRSTLFCACVVGCLGAGAALAQSADPDNAIKYRQTVFSTLGANLTAVAMNVKGEVSFPSNVAVHAQTVAATAPLIVPAMEQNTAGEGSAETDALDKIWDNWDDFVGKQQAMEEAAIRLAEVADGGDRRAVGQQLREVGNTCKSCHDEYRD